MKPCRLQYKALSLSLAALFALAGMFALCASPRSAAAQGAQEIYYCDTYYTGANYGGGGLREDGEYIFSGARDNSIRVWSFNARKCIREIKDQNNMMWVARSAA